MSKDGFRIARRKGRRPIAAPAAAPRADESAAMQSLLEAMTDAAWLVDAQTLCVDAANAAAERLFGVAAGDLAGRGAEEMLPSLEDASFWRAVRDGDRSLLCSRTTTTSADGGERMLRRSASPMTVGDRCRFLVVARDDTLHHRGERERESLLAELSATLESTADALLVTDLHGRVRSFNRRFARMWQLPESLRHVGQDAALREWMQNGVADSAGYARRLAEIETEVRLVATDVIALHSGAVIERYTQPQLYRGEPMGRVFSFRAAAGAIGRLAGAESANEASTAMAARPAFVRHADEAIANARRCGSAVAVLAIEFDGRAVYGIDGARADSERIWHDVAETLRACVRQPDIVARIGSARFAVLSRHIGELGAETLARRILGALSRRVLGDASFGALPLAVGVALYPEAGGSGNELLVDAETALANAQSAQGEPMSLYKPSEDESRRDEGLAAALQRALREGRLRLHFEPCVDLQSGETIGAEAMLRWRDPFFGEIDAGRLMAAARRSGCETRVDEWAIEQSLREATGWHARPGGPRVSVNLSTATLLKPSFARRLESMLAQSGALPASLDLEIPEAALLAEPRSAREALVEIHRLGVGIVLDDFGTGESRIGHLREFPVRALKLDRLLVVDAVSRPAQHGWIDGLVRLARAQRIEVVAKGIENEAQRRCMQSLGCGGGQGHLFGGALPRNLIEQRLLAHAA